MIEETKTELFNIEAEQAILGTIILNNEYLNRVSEFLLAQHFYEPSHQKVYEQIQYHFEKSKIVANQVTLKQFFDSEPTLKAIGGANIWQHFCLTTFLCLKETTSISRGIWRNR